MNYRIDFPEIYPPLAEDAEESCKAAWAQLFRVPCHEKVLNRAWDNSKQESIFDPRYDLYAGALCRDNCAADLESAYQLLSSQCTTRDSFDTSKYLGPLTADPYLEASPVQAVETLLRRVQHTCRASLSQTHPYSYYRPSICVAELYRDWFIVDGMNQGNLEGLENFEKVTQDTVEAPSWRADERQFAVDQGDGVYPNYQGYRDRDIKRGPKPGDTTCSWCIVNWFDRKLESWKEGEVLDPINGTVVSLPQYLTRIKEAGQRCQTEDWNRIYHKNIWAYKEKGWLPEDWKDGDSDADRSTRGKHVQAGQVEDLFLEASPEQALRMQKVIEQKVAEIQRLASEKGEDAELLRLKQEMEGWSY